MLAEEDHLPVPLKLNLAALHYIAGVDTKVRWKAWGTRGQHLEGVPWAVERERKEPYFITRGLNRRGGKEALDEYREECKTLMHAFLTGQREITEQYIHTKRFFFVCGIMRSGGTYLFKELNRKLEIDYTQRNFLMSHDSIPQFHLMAHHNNPIFQMPLLMRCVNFGMGKARMWRLCGSD